MFHVKRDPQSDRETATVTEVCFGKLLSQIYVSRETGRGGQEGVTMTLRPSPVPSLSVVTFGFSER
jgi:hypothetical protein